MSKAKFIQENGETILPITHEEAVLDNDGKNLPSKYQQKQDENLLTESKTIVGAINELSTKGGGGGEGTITSVPYTEGSDLDIEQIGGGSVGEITTNDVKIPNSNTTLSEELLAYDNWIQGIGDIAQANQDKIGETELATNDKTLTGAINELFQNVDNGKNLIATSIGEPLSAEDTFQAMSNDINGLLATFKTNMMNNGITVESGDKFKSLIDKLSTLADNEGKGIQYHTGTVKSGSSNINYLLSVGYNSATYQPACKVSVTNLPFRPLFVVLQYSSYLSVCDGNYALTTISGDTPFIFPCDLSYSNYPTMYIHDNSFEIGISRANTTCTYHIIGVGEEDTTLRDSLASILQEEGVEVSEDEDMASLIAKVDQKFDESGGGFDIISATALPSTGKEGQICVITDNPVSDFIISPNMSDYNGSTSTICALTSTSGNGLDPVLLQSNGLKQYYYFDKMYQGNTFKKSYLYKNGAWVEYTPSESILIKGGKVVNDAIFGGLAYYEGDGKTQYVKETSSGVDMYFNTTESGYYWGMCSNKTIDFSKFSTIKITHTNLTSNTDGFYVALGWEDGTTDPNEYVGFANSYYQPPTTNEWISSGSVSKSQTDTIDISSWKRKGFLVIYYHSQTGPQSVRFTEITMY